MICFLWVQLVVVSVVVIPLVIVGDAFIIIAPLICDGVFNRFLYITGVIDVISMGCSVFISFKKSRGEVFSSNDFMSFH